MSELSDLVKMLKNEKKSGSDYTGTVTRVDGSTAYINITGADIMDTPVAMTIDCKPGDNVRVRVNGGKAWISGNDTAPPTFDTNNINRLDAENRKLKDTTNILNKNINAIGDVYSLPGTVVNVSGVDSVNYELFIIPTVHLAFLRVICELELGYRPNYVRILDNLPIQLKSMNFPLNLSISVDTAGADNWEVQNGSVYPEYLTYNNGAVYVTSHATYRPVTVIGSFTYLYSELDSMYPLSAAKKINFH